MFKKKPYGFHREIKTIVKPDRSISSDEIKAIADCYGMSVKEVNKAIENRRNYMINRQIAAECQLHPEISEQHVYTLSNKLRCSPKKVEQQIERHKRSMVVVQKPKSSLNIVNAEHPVPPSTGSMVQIPGNRLSVTETISFAFRGKDAFLCLDTFRYETDVAYGPVLQQALHPQNFSGHTTGMNSSFPQNCYAPHQAAPIAHIYPSYFAPHF